MITRTIKWKALCSDWLLQFRYKITREGFKNYPCTQFCHQSRAGKGEKSIKGDKFSLNFWMKDL